MSYIVPKEIPKHCFACPCGYETEGAFRDECSVLAREDEKDAVLARPNWCPLIEIKKPHGRLIDADALKSKFRHSEGDSDTDSAWISTIRRFITQAETIIEAEGEKRE